MARVGDGLSSHLVSWLNAVNGPPKALAKDGVMRPVPEPKSSQANGRFSGTWRAKASIQVRSAPDDICLPTA
jgi:hypothetical protein